MFVRVCVCTPGNVRYSQKVSSSRNVNRPSSHICFRIVRVSAPPSTCAFVVRQLGCARSVLPV
jgi:hypothetical protein